MTRRALLVLMLLLVPLAACRSTGGAAVTSAEPEAATGFAAREAVRARSFMIAAANPHAAETGRAMLAAGGSAIDAAIAAQAVLTLVEPQSSGLGGGGYLLHWDADAGRISAHDGRETAPAAADETLWLDSTGRPWARADARVGARSVGVPGLLRMLEDVHRRHGRLPWARLFEPAIALAENGFAISPRLHRLAAGAAHLKRFPASRAYLFDAVGDPLPIGHRLVNKPFAAVLRTIARDGADAFYRGDIARDIAAAVQGAAVHPGLLRESDLAGYKALERTVVCAPYRAWRVCGHGPSTTGGIAVNMILGLLAPFDMRALGPDSAEAVHLFTQASRLAYADRNRHVGDPDFIDVPVAGLLDPDYLRQRAGLIAPSRDMGAARPGSPPGATSARLGGNEETQSPSTTHLSVVDARGNAVSLTSSIAIAFGSGLLTHGFFLNNQLTDFAFRPEVDRRLHVNRAAGGKRPRSSMSPTLVFDAGGKLALVVGSPGGTNIIGYVAKTLVAVLDWDMDLQEAVSLPHFAQRNRKETEIEKDTSAERFRQALEARGHSVTLRAMTSGLHGIHVTPDGLLGAADPRREGAVMGQ